MKTLKISDYESYLLEQALKQFMELIAKEQFSSNSIVTKEFIQHSIEELQNKISSD